MKNSKALREFFRYSFFNVLGMLGLSFYILADTFFISRSLGADGLTALNLAIPVYNVINGCGLMLGMGAATRYSILKSRKEQAQSDRLFSNTVFFTLLLAAGFVLLGLYGAEPLTALLGADDSIFPMTCVYLRVILLFSPAFLMNNLLLCFVRNDGNPRLAMLAMLFGSLFNIVFDYIFLFPMKLGIFGAVLATGFSPVVGMLLLSLHFLRKKNGFHLVRAVPSLRLAGTACTLGFPSLVSEVSAGFVIIIFNFILLKQAGNVGVAAYGVIANLSLVVTAVYTAVAQGVQPLLSRAYGSRDIPAVRQFLRYALITAVTAAFLLYLGIFFFAEPITAVFNHEGNRQLQEIAVSGLRLYFLSSAFIGVNLVLPVFFTSTETPLPAHILSLLRGFFLIIPLAFLLSSLFGITGVWLSFPATEAAVSLIGWCFFRRFGKKE